MSAKQIMIIRPTSPASPSNTTGFSKLTTIRSDSSISSWAAATELHSILNAPDPATGHVRNDVDSHQEPRARCFTQTLE